MLRYSTRKAWNHKPGKVSMDLGQVGSFLACKNFELVVLKNQT
jgi:hypothetical protein